MSRTAETTSILSIDPATGERWRVTDATSAEEVSRIAERAERAASALEALGRSGRADLLRMIADRLEQRRGDIVKTGMRETALPESRLNGELTRTVYQARFFAEVLDEGSYLEATIDHAQDTPTGPGPDLRRMLVPIGPVAVFGASNFPLAFSVPGGDTVSALAAGSPVVLKAHSSHPALSRLCFEVLEEAADAIGAPAGTVGIVYGTQAGAELVAHPSIQAVGFTGSLSGGKALLAIIDERQLPIPFYGELSSLNPLVVTDRAAAKRGGEIAEGLVTSITASGGQLCTKPGLVFIPEGESGDSLVQAVAQRIEDAPPTALLNSRISDAYQELGDLAVARKGVTVLATGTPAPEQGSFVSPQVLTVTAKDFDVHHAEERFGPAAVVVRYAGPGELSTAISRLPASLTASLFGESDEVEQLQALETLIRPRAGRILYNQFPTGVLVSWAQHHGGPWPSTNTIHTSVGATAIRRFLRPLVWQNAPQAALPEELREVAASGIVRRIDGRLTLPTES